MKRIAILMMGAAVALSLSCNKEESYTTGSDSNVVSFSAGDIRTRVTGTSFELGDIISVQAYQDGAAFASAEYTYAGNSNEFTSSEPISYQGDEAIELSYQAVYPAVESFSNSFTHTISTDQSVAENYESSDLLVATVDATESLKPSLNFVHAMSRVNLTMIVNRDGVASTTDAVSSLKINAAVEATCDITADTYEAVGSAMEITPAGSELEYSVLVAPQTISAGGFAVVTIGDNAFSMANVEATLASGYVYELEWTIELTTGAQSVEIVGIIEEWTPGVWGDEDSSEEEDETVDTPTVTEPVTIYAADWGLANSENIETTTLQGYTFSFAGTATTSSNTAKYYSSSNGTIRYYTGDVMTIASADGSNISQIVFDTDGSATMTTTTGTFDADSKTWTGSASSIEFAATATTKIESLIISAE